MAETDYSKLTPDQLLKRVKDLEEQLKHANQRLQKARSPKSRPSRSYDASRYSTRHIALKFAYLGKKYNGFEHHANNITPLRTIEEVLWRALAKARLIWPEDGNDEQVNWDGCDYSKCGRTDRGVSAFGQVIGVRVRSNRPLPQTNVSPMEKDVSPQEKNNSIHAPFGMEDLVLDMPNNHTANPSSKTPEGDFEDIHDEIPYVSVLNRILPPEIRVLAWCPAPLNFSARFSCRERRYRYFFTQPAFNPTPGTAGYDLNTSKDSQGNSRREGWLDIGAMKEAAKKYEGLHDFRNFCKIDASKQIENFQRRMFLSEIREVDPAQEPAAYVAGPGFAEMAAEATGISPTGIERHGPKVYQFVLHGSAFLWHQVRHMIAILFLIGQGLEPATVIDDMLNIEKTPSKPNYVMADDTPLVLWDCIFPEAGIDMPTESLDDAMPWIWIGDTGSADGTSTASIGAKEREKFGLGGVVDEVWKLWRSHKIDEILAGSLLNLAVEAGGPGNLPLESRGLQRGKKKPSKAMFLGGSSAEKKGQYIPLLQRPRSEPPEVVNARYRERKGIVVRNTNVDE